MSKKLAIKGHPTRGNEVIELFKMMGGWECGYCGCGTGLYYYISQFGNIEASCKPSKFDTYIVYTLEEFWEKYPFKVGDVIKFPNNMAEEIAKMKWDEELEDIIYTSVSGWTRPCSVPKNTNKANMNMNENKVESTGFMQMGKTVAVCFNPENYENEVELQLGDYEIEVRDGKTYAVKKKPKYPTTHEECCEVIGISQHDVEIDLPQPYQQKMFNLFKLRICRDAYWKIAGKQMGLGKPWEPDWNESKPKYTIVVLENKLVKHYALTLNYILAFPTEEIRDAFYENFKNEIEECKELL